MKKTPLFAATALLSALLASGLSQAATTDKAATDTTKTTTESSTAAPSMMRGRREMPKLSEASQKLMTETMGKLHEDNKATFDELRAKHKELQDILKAPKFDKSAYLAKHDEIRVLEDKLAKVRAEAMASVAEKMTAEERAQFTGPHMMGPMGPMGRHSMMGKGMGPNGSMTTDDSGTASKTDTKTTK